MIGGVLVSGGEMLASIEDLICAEDFALHEHQTIWRVMCDLDASDSPVDVVTCIEELNKRGLIGKFVSPDTVAKIAGNTPGSRNIRAYAEIVRERSIRRKLMSIAQGIYAEAGAEDDIEEILSESQSKIMEIGQERGYVGPRPVSDFVTNWFDGLDRRARSEDKLAGISTGYPDLDKKIGGLEPGNLVVVAGRPSMGKTALAMNIMANIVYRQGLPCLYFSLEMSSDEILTRLVSQKARIPMEKIRTGDIGDEDWTTVNETMQFFSGVKHMLIDDSGDMGLQQIRARARRMKIRHGRLGAIFVDYVGLMKTNGEVHRAQAIGEITRGLKKLAKELDAPLIMLSQLNREVERRNDKRPVLADLKESGDIEQDADVVMFVYRDVVYNEATRYPRAAEVIIGKQRNGPTGTVVMMYFGDYTTFGAADVSFQQEFWHHRMESERTSTARQPYKSKKGFNDDF